tara:strand:+ start:1124 stop:3343 length:2220 start_codon:yes stop_codon:yes gene_type:complete
MYTNKPSTDVRAPANLNWITRRGADFDPGFAMTEEQERELRISILMGQGLTRAEAEAEIDGLYRYPPPGHRPDLIQPIRHIEDEEEPPETTPRDLPRTKGKDLDGAGAPNETQGTYLQDLATIPVPGQPRANTPLRMLEVLGSIGGEFLAGRSQNKAIKEAAASQASANLINALRPGAGARGTPAVAEQTFLETLAKGVGKGAGAIRSVREAGDAGEAAEYNRQIGRAKEKELHRRWLEDFDLKKTTEERLLAAAKIPKKPTSTEIKSKIGVLGLEGYERHGKTEGGFDLALEEARQDDRWINFIKEHPEEAAYFESHFRGGWEAKKNKTEAADRLEANDRRLWQQTISNMSKENRKNYLNDQAIALEGYEAAIAAEVGRFAAGEGLRAEVEGEEFTPSGYPSLKSAEEWLLENGWMTKENGKSVSTSWEYRDIFTERTTRLPVIDARLLGRLKTLRAAGQNKLIESRISSAKAVRERVRENRELRWKEAEEQRKVDKENLAEAAYVSKYNLAFSTGLRDIETYRSFVGPQGSLNVFSSLNALHKAWHTDKLGKDAYQVAVMNFFQRGIDPATVREGDVALARSAASWKDQITADIMTKAEGGLLDVGYVENMYNVAKAIHEAQRNAFLVEVDRYVEGWNGAMKDKRLHQTKDQVLEEAKKFSNAAFYTFESEEKKITLEDNLSLNEFVIDFARRFPEMTMEQIMNNWEKYKRDIAGEDLPMLQAGGEPIKPDWAQDSR